MQRLIGLLFLVWFLDFDASGAFAEVTQPTNKTVSVTPVIDTNIYASGDALGGLQTLTGAGRAGIGSGVIHSLAVTDLDKESADLDVIIFDSNPSATTVTNNAALDVADADLTKIVCVIQITNDATFNDNGVSFALGNNCVFKAETLYAVAVARSAPTYASASDLTFRYSILQD